MQIETNKLLKSMVYNWWQIIIHSLKYSRRDVSKIFPIEIWLIIMSYLKGPDLLNLNQASKFFNQYTTGHEALWSGFIPIHLKQDSRYLTSKRTYQEIVKRLSPLLNAPGNYKQLFKNGQLNIGDLMLMIKSRVDIDNELNPRGNPTYLHLLLGDSLSTHEKHFVDKIWGYHRSKISDPWLQRHGLSKSDGIANVFNDYERYTAVVLFTNSLEEINLLYEKLKAKRSNKPLPFIIIMSFNYSIKLSEISFPVLQFSYKPFTLLQYITNDPDLFGYYNSLYREGWFELAKTIRKFVNVAENLKNFLQPMQPLNLEDFKAEENSSLVNKIVNKKSLLIGVGLFSATAIIGNVTALFDASISKTWTV